MLQDHLFTPPLGALNCIAGEVVTFVLLFNWAGIYLYLVTANKNLTNLLKVMLNFDPYY